MSDFEIKRTITEKDIPPKKGRRGTKYQPLLDSMKTLEVDEGIEVKVSSNRVVYQLKRLAKTHHKNRHYEITGRTKTKGHFIYIIRHQ
jgi:hypothetical protein